MKRSIAPFATRVSVVVTFVLLQFLSISKAPKIEARRLNRAEVRPSGPLGDALVLESRYS
jgi:hypothetical protein